MQVTARPPASGFKMLPLGLALSLAASLSGCIPYALFMSDSVEFDEDCRSATFPGRLAVKKLGDWNYNGHMLGIDRNQREFVITLASMPTEAADFKPPDIEVRDFTLQRKSNVTGGSVHVDPMGRKLWVDLQVAGKPFWGNGRYAIAEVAHAACHCPCNASQDAGGASHDSTADRRCTFAPAASAAER